MGLFLREIFEFCGGPGALLFGNFIISFLISPEEQDSEDAWVAGVSEMTEA